MLNPGDDLEVRDTAVIAWLWSTGRRWAEAVGQLIENYQRKEWAVKILGKGHKQRAGYLHPEAIVYVGRWLALVGHQSPRHHRPVRLAPRAGAARRDRPADHARRRRRLTAPAVPRPGAALPVVL